MITMINKDRVIYALTLAIEAKFDESDWTKLAYEIDEVDAIEGHSRLLRSLSWRDPDYTQNVIGVLKNIGKNENKLENIVSVEMLYPALFKWLGGVTLESPLFYLPKYGGTVTRDLFKMNVYNMRPNKGYLLTTIM